MNLELDEHQTKLAIYAFEQMAFKRCQQADEFRLRSMLLEAQDLFFLASKCRQAIGWPEIDDDANRGMVMKANL